LLFFLFFIFLIDFLFNFIPNHLVLFDFHIKFSSHAFIIFKSFHQLICFSNFISHHLILISFSCWILPLFFYCCLLFFGSFFIFFFRFHPSIFWLWSFLFFFNSISSFNIWFLWNWYLCCFFFHFTFCRIIQILFPWSNDWQVNSN
jgi:hypothetical protein